MPASETLGQGPQGLNALDVLAPEQREKAYELAGAMADHFDVHDSDFSIVYAPDIGHTAQFAVVYALSEGIDLGDPDLAWDEARSWNSIRGKQANADDFIVELTDGIADTRTGMTRGIYEALIAQVKDRCGPLPDRAVPYTNREGFYHPRTWLTGESAKPHSALFGNVEASDEAQTYWIRRDYENASTLFRPAVILE